MTIAIIGTGGVGGYFGAKLAKTGYNVKFLARGKNLEVLQNNGLKIKSFKGNFELKTVFATDTFSELGQPDLVILAVKAWQIRTIVHEINGILHENSIILPLQNGIFATDELAQVIDRKHIIEGFCRIMSEIESPGVISHTAIEPTITFGETDNSKSVRILKIKEIFDNADIRSVISEDIQADLWRKFNAICVSGLLAVTQSSYGEIGEIPETRQMMIELMNEIFAVSQKIGLKIEPDFVQKTVAYTDTLPYESTSSMSRDILSGKPSEIEYQNGTVVKLGERYGVATPINKFVYHSILPMEKRARKSLEK